MCSRHIGPRCFAVFAASLINSPLVECAHWYISTWLHFRHRFVPRTDISWFRYDFVPCTDIAYLGGCTKSWYSSRICCSWGGVNQSRVACTRIRYIYEQVSIFDLLLYIRQSEYFLNRLHYEKYDSAVLGLVLANNIVGAETRLGTSRTSACLVSVDLRYQEYSEKARIFIAVMLLCVLILRRWIYLFLQRALQIALAVLDGYRAGVLRDVNHLVFEGDEDSNLRDCITRDDSSYPLGSNPPQGLDLVDWVYIIGQVEVLGWQRLDLRWAPINTKKKLYCPLNNSTQFQWSGCSRWYFAWQDSDKIDFFARTVHEVSNKFTAIKLFSASSN